MKGKYLLDTNILVAFLEGEYSVVEKFMLREAECLISVVSVSELMFGAYKSKSWMKNHKRYSDFLSRLSKVPINSDVAETNGLIKAVLREQGIILTENDLWIASTAIHYRLTLVTRDQDFQRIKNFQLGIEAW
jgi:tRNA(fMet)-specific endonuclease VapC